MFTFATLKSFFSNLMNTFESSFFPPAFEQLGGKNEKETESQV